MASVSDFLFNGSAPASTTTYGTTTANLPQWYNDFLQGVAAKGNALAAEPFQNYGQPRIAGFTGDQNKAFQATRDMQGAYDGTLNSAISKVQSTPTNGATAASSGYLGAAAGMNGATAAQPYATNAAKTATGTNLNAYMDPYIQNVVDRTGTLAARNLSEKLMPAIGDDFIRAGQYGSTRMMGEVGNALRDTNDSMTQQIGTLLSGGFNNAQSAFQTDANRQAGLASTMGSLTNTAASNMANIGQVAGNMANADASTQINAGSKLADMATAGQSMDLKDAAALQAVGNQQQQLNQSNLDMAYGDFQNQTNYPKDQLNWVNNLIKGYQMPQSSTNQTTNQAATNSSSNLGTITGGLGTLLSAFKAKGGAVKPTDIKMVEPMAKAAIAFDRDVRRGGLGAMKKKPASKKGRATSARPMGGLSALRA